jgi:D-aminopeptidase
MASAAADEGKRIRDIGVAPGVMTPGPLNAITDVNGVAVGHVTRIEGDGVRTGVTAILPHDGDLFFEKTPAAVYTGNGFGKPAGFEQVRELGEIESPIVLTNTLAVGTAVSAVVRWTLDRPGHGDVRSVNAVVGETNDGVLNDIRGRHVTEDDVLAAIAAARSGPVEEGAVGAGTGTIAFGFKGGIGTSSRRLPKEDGGYTVGVLVQTNYGGLLTIDGMRVGEALGRIDRKRFRAGSDSAATAGGSVMIVVATDAPADARNLERMAKRALLGIARTGGIMENGSGDFVIAFSTANRIDVHARRRTDEITRLRNDAMSLLFLATVEATEEAVYNSLAAAVTMTGRGGKTIEALPVDHVRSLFK